MFGTVPAKTAQVASTTISIVFLTVDHPVTVGLVADLDRPGGNVTVSAWSALRWEREAGTAARAGTQDRRGRRAPRPARTESQDQSRDVQDASALGVRVVVLNAGTASEIDTAFGTLVQRRVGTLLVGGSPTFGSLTSNLSPSRPATRCRRCTRPANIRGRRPNQLWREHFGFYRQTAIYVGPILKGDRPSDLPVLRPTKFELVINLKAAEDTRPRHTADKLLARADEVIE